MAIYPLRNLSLTPCIHKDFFPLGTVCYHEQFYAFLLVCVQCNCAFWNLYAEPIPGSICGSLPLLEPQRSPCSSRSSLLYRRAQDCQMPAQHLMLTGTYRKQALTENIYTHARAHTHMCTHTCTHMNLQVEPVSLMLYSKIAGRQLVFLGWWHFPSSSKTFRQVQPPGWKGLGGIRKNTTKSGVGSLLKKRFLSPLRPFHPDYGCGQNWHHLPPPSRCPDPCPHQAGVPALGYLSRPQALSPGSSDTPVVCLLEVMPPKKTGFPESQAFKNCLLVYFHLFSLADWPPPGGGVLPQVALRGEFADSAVTPVDPTASSRDAGGVACQC